MCLCLAKLLFSSDHPPCLLLFPEGWSNVAPSQKELLKLHWNGSLFRFQTFFTMYPSEKSWKASINKKYLWLNQIQLTTIYLMHVDWVWIVTLDDLGGFIGCNSYFSKTFDNYWYLFSIYSVFLCYALFELPIEFIHSMISACPLLLQPFYALINAHISLFAAHQKWCGPYHDCNNFFLNIF